MKNIFLSLVFLCFVNYIFAAQYPIANQGAWDAYYASITGNIIPVGDTVVISGDFDFTHTKALPIVGLTNNGGIVVLPGVTMTVNGSMANNGSLDVHGTLTVTGAFANTSLFILTGSFTVGNPQITNFNIFSTEDIYACSGSLDGITVVFTPPIIPIPEGTPCNDGDATTTMDSIDMNCNCVGMAACTPPDGLISLSTTEICDGGRAQLSFSATEGDFPMTINVSPFGDQTINSDGITFWTLTTDWYNLGDNTYTLNSITDNNGCMTTGIDQEVTLTVNPDPEGAISLNVPEICDGGQAFLSFSATEGDFPMTINVSPFGDQIINNDGDTFWTLTDDWYNLGDNTYTLNSITGACMTTGIDQEVTLTVNPNPEGAISLSTTEACEGGQAFLSFSATEGDFPMTINVSPFGDQTINSDGITFWTLTTDWYNLGDNTYTLNSITDANGCMTTGIDQEVTLTVNPVPEGAISLNVPEICDGGQAFLSFSATEGDFPMTINVSPFGDQIINGDGITFWTLTDDWYNLGDNTYTLNSITDFNGCMTTGIDQEVTLTVIPIPTPAVITGDQTICEGEIPATLYGDGSNGSTAPAGDPNLSHQWQSSTTSASSGFVNIGSATSLSYTPPALSDTTYYRLVTSTDAASNCGDTSNVVTVYTVDCSDLIMSATTTDISASDPCSCEDPDNCTQEEIYYFHDTLVLMSMVPVSGLTIEIAPGTAVDFYTGTGCPDLSLATTELILEEGNTGVYKLEFWRPSGQIPQLSISINGGTPQAIDSADFGDPCLEEVCFPKPIPTLGQWGIIVLSMMMLIFGVVFVRIRKRDPIVVTE